MVKKLDQYILKAFVGPFLAVLLVVLFILVMQFLWLYIDELVGKGLGLWVILEFMMWGACTILPLAMPLAVLLSSVMMLGQMTENNELMAVKASGVSLARVLLPLMLTASVISLAAFFANNNLVPKAYNEIFTLRDDIGRTKSEIKIPTGIFYEGIDGYILRVGDRDKRTGLMRDVMVYDHTDGKGNVAVTTADSARMEMSRDKDFLIFTLYSGCNYQEGTERGDGKTKYSLQKMDFSLQELVIPLKNYSFQKSEENRYGTQTKSMRFLQLYNQRDSLLNAKETSQVQNYRRFLTSGNLMFQTQLDTTYGPTRTVSFKGSGPMEWATEDKEIRAYEEAARKSSEAKSYVSAYSSQAYEYVFFLRRTEVELFKKLAQALACFVLFFIGAPLGTLIGKGGLGSSAIVSALFFVLYWVIDISGTKLANDGAVNAILGVFVSTLVLFPIGLILTWKAINDRPVFAKVDSFKSLWRRLKSRTKGLFHKPRIVFMGTPEFAVASLDALVGAGFKVVGAVTVADKPSGRGLKVSESAVKRYAVSHGIPVLQPLKLKDPEFLSALRAWRGDIFVVVAFRMLPEEVWRMPALGTFNLHAALLPQYRGAAPINWAVINGERITGATTFMIDKDIDTGGIILRQELRIKPGDTASDVHDALMPIGAELVLQTVQGLIEGSVETRVQRSFVQGSEVLRPAPKLTRELCHIDWNDSPAAVHNLVRGLSDFPAAFTELKAEGEEPVQLKIFRSHIHEAEGSFEPGRIYTDGKTYLAVGAAGGALDLDEVQLAGKKRMDIKSFLAGFRGADRYVCTKGTSKTELERVKALYA